MNESEGSPDNKEFFIANISSTEGLKFEIKARIVELFGEQIEPERKKGEEGSFIYSVGERPNRTFVIYILESQILKSLAEGFGKLEKGLHIHKGVNTNGDMICFPEQINSIEEAKNMFSNWCGLIGALFSSEVKGDINDFYDRSDSNWVKSTISNHGIDVEIECNK